MQGVPESESTAGGGVELMGIYEKLHRIQMSLVVPKTQKNTFGNYWYRSAEQILEAVKPLLGSLECTLIIDDDLTEMNGYTFLKATATLRDLESGEEVQSHAYAKHPWLKKGADDAQITGSVSSYARKYALNGLFCIDDNKDRDTEEAQKEERLKAYAADYDEHPVKCRKCGKVFPALLNGMQHGQTVTITAQEYAKMMGGLCGACAKAERDGAHTATQTQGNPVRCTACGKEIPAMDSGTGKIPPEEYAKQSGGLCPECYERKGQEYAKHTGGTQ